MHKHNTAQVLVKQAKRKIYGRTSPQRPVHSAILIIICSHDTAESDDQRQ